MEKLSNKKDLFIEKARQIHGNKYDYSETEYIDTQTKICIICPKHGKFYQRPTDHLRGHGCKKCGIETSKDKQKMSYEKLLKKLYGIYGDKYDFSESLYVNTDTKIKCFCPIHGEFWQTPHHLLTGVACERCGTEKMIRTKTAKSALIFENRARNIHGDKYDYSKVKYITANDKVCIICPEHGIFWQSPAVHINGKHGCPKCNSSKLENSVRNFLIENNFNFEEQKTFEWLKYKGNQYLDFYLPDYNIAIECQGIQHFKPVDFANKGDKWAIKEFKKSVERDKKKNILCNNNGIKILFYSNEEYPGMITNLDVLKENIIV